MKKLICLLGILLMLTLLIPSNQAEAYHGSGWFLPGLIIGSALWAWSLAPRYYYPPAYYYPPPAYYSPPPPYYYPPPGEVSQAPTNKDSQAPPMGGQVFIYPRQGQSQEKLESDRNGCHSWAVGQTGYDPTKMSPSMPLDQRAQKSADFLRAMGACLDARGYSMR